MIERLISPKLVEELTHPEINILIGPRQVGKTTLLKYLYDFVQKQGKTASYFDLEQPGVLAEFNASDVEIVRKIQDSGDVVFIDEFQYIKNASKILKAVFDSKTKKKIFCSGSSSLEMHHHLKESLAGRRFLFRIYPLEFSEIKKHFRNHSIETYFQYGGMPALTHTASAERKELILSELLSAYILKDIKSLVKEENIRAFNQLLYLLAENQGSLISIHSLANEITMSSKAVNRYLDILEATFVNFRIYSYSSNLGNELKKSCKTYLYDLGMRNAILKDFSSLKERKDKGTLQESYVFLKLNSNLKPNMEIKFWRTKQGDEVDFILVKDRLPIPIEVKSKIQNMEIPKGLKQFLRRYPNVEKAFVINENMNRTIKNKDCLIEFVTFENFEALSF